MMLAFAKPVVAGIMLVASGSAIPHIDVDRTCKDTAGADGFQKCMQEEAYALQKIRKCWASTPAADKKQCMLDPLPPDPSYVIFRDCLNNLRMIRDHKAE